MNYLEKGSRNCGAEWLYKIAIVNKAEEYSFQAVTD